MKKILIPVDSSEFSERALEQGKVMAKAFGSEVVLLYVVGLGMGSKRFGVELSHIHAEDPYLKKEGEGAEEMLANYKDSFGELKDKVEIKILKGSVADEIIKTANDTDVDFVIMGSHGIGSALYRTLLGSVANKVVHNSTKPVLVVR